MAPLSPDDRRRRRPRARRPATPSRARRSSRSATSPRSRTAGSARGHGARSPSWSASRRPRCSAPPPSTRCSTPSRSGTTWSSVCTNIACMLARRLRAARPRRGRARRSRPAARPPTAMFTLEEAECLADCDRGPVPAGQPPLLRRRSTPTSLRQPRRRPAGRAPGRRRPPARHARPGPPQRWAAAARRRRHRRGRPSAARRRGRRGDGRGARLMAITDAPRIVTSRSSYDDSHTLERYLATGGYEGLRKALGDDARGGGGRGRRREPARAGRGRVPGRAQVVDAAQGPTTLPGRQRRRERAGDLQGPPARSSATRTSSSRASLIAAYAIQAPQAFIYVRGEFALGLERVQQALQRGLRPRRASARDIFGSGFSIDVVVHPGAGAYICGEETALLESLEGKRGFPRIKPPYFPAAIGLYGEPTVVNNVETLSNLPWIVDQRRRGLRRARGGAAPPGPGCSPWPATSRNPGCVRGRDGRRPPSATSSTTPSSAAASAADSELKAFIPGGVSAPWFGPEHLDLAARPGRGGRGRSMLGSGSIVVMDDDDLRRCGPRGGSRGSSAASRAASARRVGRERLAGEDPAPHRGRRRAARATSTCSWTSATTLARACRGRRSRRRSACSARRSRRRSPRRIRMFRDEFLVHVKDGRVPLWLIPSSPRTDIAAGRRRRVTFTLDGRRDRPRPTGELLIAAAERAGIFIPRFCYHPRMKPVGMCRMCLVEVDGPRGATLQPACFIAVADGMEVDTTSEKVKKAQDGVLEFLLVNHPLDCPVCDKGGECPLQDQTLAYGPGESRFLEEKRHWAKPIADLRAGAARPRALHPVRPLHPLRRRGRRRGARSTSSAAATRSRSRPSRRSPSPRTSAATPCRSARSARSRRRRTGSRPGRGTSTRSSRRARPARSAAGWRSQSSSNRVTRLLGHRLRPGEPELAVRQGPLRLRGGQRGRGGRRSGAERAGRRGRRRGPGDRLAVVASVSAGVSSWARSARRAASSTVGWSNRGSARRRARPGQLGRGADRRGGRALRPRPTPAGPGPSG